MRGREPDAQQPGQVGEGALSDFFVLAEGLAQQHGGRGVAVGDALNVHGYTFYGIKTLKPLPLLGYLVKSGGICLELPTRASPILANSIM